MISRGGEGEDDVLQRMRAYSGDSLLGGDNMMDELDFDIPGDIFECGVLDGSVRSMHSLAFATSAASGTATDATAPMGLQDTTGGGGVMNDTQEDVVSRRRSSFNIDRMVTVASRGPRTARVNPYLAMLEQQQQQQQQQGGSQQRELSSLQTTWNNVDVGGKRRRRKSKRFGIDYDDDSNEDEDESGGGGGGGDKDVINTTATASKRSRRSSNNNSSSPKIAHSTSNSHHQERDLGKLYSQSQQGYNQSTQHPMSVVVNAQQHQYLPQYEKEVKGRKSFKEYGLSHSRSKFFPYINLPNEVVDVKKRGQQQRGPYRCLEQLSTANVGGGIYIPPTTATGTIITKDSPIYKLFGQHIGIVDMESSEIVGFGGMGMSIGNNQQHRHSQHSPATSSTLITSLTKSTEVVQNMVHQLRKSRQQDKLAPLVDSAVVATSSSSPQQLIDDLVTLYSSHVRQAAFLRQNLINMEYWCEDNYKKKDVREVCPVPRRNVEKVLRSLWEYKVHNYTHQQNQVLLDDGNCATRNSTSNTLMITINVKVKVKGQNGMPGFRDKSGKKLVAQMSCPKDWKVAKMCGAVTATGEISATSSNPPTLDLSFADMETIKVVANETLRFDLLPQKIKIAASTTDTSLISYNCPVIFNNATVKNSLPFVATKAMGYVKKIQSPVIQHKKELVKKSKSDCATIASVTNVPSISSLSIPYIPGDYHQILKEDDDEEDEYRQERHRRVRALYGSILYPNLSLAERRSLLAKETSSTSVRQNEQNQTKGSVASSGEINRIDVIDRQIMELQETYLDDVKMMPETCSTIGLWNYMTKSNYFDGIERKEDVHFGLEGIINQSDEIVTKELEESSDKNSDVGHSLWGSISEENTKRCNCDDQNGNEAISPIYERLQSLLVEEESGDYNEETDDDDDYDILTKLSSYSPEEFTNGLIGLGNIDAIKNGDIATLDLSALTLDQRTYIQLCSAGLIDTKRTPYSSIVSSCSSSSDDLSSSSTVQTISEDNKDEEDFETGTRTENVDSIVQKMMCRLAVLNVESKEEVSKLRRLALAYVDATSKSAIAAAISTHPGLSSSPIFQSKTEEERSGETLILMKYKQLERQKRKEKLLQVVARTSGRAKTASKFDEEEWLPF